MRRGLRLFLLWLALLAIALPFFIGHGGLLDSLSGIVACAPTALIGRVRDRTFFPQLPSITEPPIEVMAAERP